MRRGIGHPGSGPSSRLGFWTGSGPQTLGSSGFAFAGKSDYADDPVVAYVILVFERVVLTERVGQRRARLVIRVTTEI